jgi:hypothetical protein
MESRDGAISSQLGDWQRTMIDTTAQRAHEAHEATSRVRETKNVVTREESLKCWLHDVIPGNPIVAHADF